ncbi:hypothetical protein EGI22_11275 [Lacihabitans sp. LS3-19]|uniref:tetratricopeptide repeat-containing sensor histidine kinase n=1 Tax=Lacihabitans sp. LS3-19 TaxID=2487335 RepID=UPI0020CE8347|nr:ATP-binding protein [Lacihabitans sp. LS3-19]MCP9768495.1 hypothetical protein [Lacihabitans sp. LS3-19]
MKIKFKLFFISFLFLPFVGYSQDVYNLDSLKTILSQKMQDTSRVILLEQIAKDLWNNDLEAAMSYAQQGLELAQKINFDKGEVRCQNRIGAIYSRMGNHQKGLVTLFDALAFAKNIGDLEDQARILINLGVIYGEQLDYRKAIEYYKDGLKISEEINNKDLIQLSFLNIGSDFFVLEKYDSAQYYAEKSYELAVKINSSDLDIVQFNLGNIQYKKKNYDKALSLFKVSSGLSLKLNKKRYLALSQYMIAKTYHIKNQLDSAMIFAMEANKLAKETVYLEIIADSYSLLSTLNEKTNPKLALEYFKSSAIAKDSLNNLDKNLQIQKLTYKENILNEDLAFSKKEMRKNQILFIIGSILFLFAIISANLFVLNRNKTKANKTLTKQKNLIEHQKIELQESLEQLKNTQKRLMLQEKLASLGELTAGIAHEIQNPLNFVNNFSEISIEVLSELKELLENLKAKDQSEIEELIDILMLNQNKINVHGKRASGIVKSMLEHSRGTQEVISDVDINKIADEYLRLSYHGMRAKDVDFNSDFAIQVDENLPLIKGNIGNLERVLLNLINNAFYAVNQKKKENKNSEYKPKVIVKTNLTENEKGKFAEIRVLDNGNGIPENIKQKIFQPFFSTKPTGEGTGLGLSLSREIITNGHNGILELESKEGEGTTFIIKLPLN